MASSELPQREPFADWIGNELERLAQARKEADDSSTHPTIVQVPPYIKMTKPEAYEHDVLSFGVYNRDFFNKKSMDKVRLEVVSEFLQQMKATPYLEVHSWEDLCALVTGPLESAEQLRRFYENGPRESHVSSEMIRSALTLDAVFLMVFAVAYGGSLDGILLPKKLWSPLVQTGVEHYLGPLFIDLWLSENQIPLKFVRRVWDLVQSDNSDRRFNAYIKRLVLPAVTTYLRPRAEFRCDDNYPISFINCDHLLHCLYQAFCQQNAPASEFQDPDAARLALASSTTCLSRRKVRNPTSDSRDQIFRSMLPVTELHRAGIIVRGEMRTVSEIRLVKSTFFKATIYLPQIEISDSTEKILRNLLAFELFHSKRENHKLVSYLRIMDDLINTEEDVRLLRKGKDPVICLNYLGDDKDIAALFNTLGQNVWFTQSEECRKLAKDVDEWCTHKKRQMFIRFMDRFIDRPWILFSLLAAILLLAMTALQTTYTIMGFYQQS